MKKVKPDSIRKVLVLFITMIYYHDHLGYVRIVLTDEISPMEIYRASETVFENEQQPSKLWVIDN